MATVCSIDDAVDFSASLSFPIQNIVWKSNILKSCGPI